EDRPALDQELPGARLPQPRLLHPRRPRPHRPGSRRPVRALLQISLSLGEEGRGWSAHCFYVGRKLFQKSIGALRSRFGSVLAIEKKGLLGISQFSSRRSFRELDAGERNGKGLPRDEHVKCVDQTYILVDEVETRGVDGFRAVLKPAVGDFLSADPEVDASSYCGPGRPGKPVLSMFQLRPGSINQLAGRVDVPFQGQGPMLQGRLHVQVVPGRGVRRWRATPRSASPPPAAAPPASSSASARPATRSARPRARRPSPGSAGGPG